MPGGGHADTVVDFLRHGEPRGGSRYRGHGIDDPLSERGWAQMWRAVAGRGGWTAIVSSPMARCVEFANALGERSQLPVQIDARWREVGFGDWEGRTRDELVRERGAEVEAFYRDPVHNRPAGAEPLEQFVVRVRAAYDSLLEGHAGGHVLVICHAGVIRAALAYALDAPVATMYRMHVDNAGMSRVRHGGRGPVLEWHNTAPPAPA